MTELQDLYEMLLSVIEELCAHPGRRLKNTFVDFFRIITIQPIPESKLWTIKTL
jgi:hypothetical protein